MSAVYSSARKPAAPLDLKEKQTVFVRTIRWRPGGSVLSLALLGSITLSGSAASVYAAQPALAELPSGVVVQGEWVCQSWQAADAPRGEANAAAGETLSVANGTTTRCIRHWHRDADGQIVSDDPAWVQLWQAPVAQESGADRADGQRFQRMPRLLTTPTHTTVAPAAHVAYHPLSVLLVAPSSPPAPPPFTGGTYGPWAPVPGHPGYAMSDFAGDPYSSYFGTCTWYAWSRHQNEPLLKLGQAYQWAYNAPGAGLHTGSSPAVGATVVFAPGVEGAGGEGHVAHVETLLDNGWFIVSEMNFAINGGGWGRVDYRYAHVGGGVTFIY